MNKAMGEKDLILALRAQGVGAAEARDLAVVAGALALVSDPEIDAAFADALEARLLAEPLEAETTSPVVTQMPRPLTPVLRPVPAPETSRPMAPVIPLPRRRFTMRKTFAIAIAAAMLLALPVAASANALPSSPFYRVKIALETLRLGLTRGDLAKGFYELNRAGVRLGEADQEASLGDNAHVVQALTMMRRSQANGSRLIQSGSPSLSDLERLRTTLLGYAKQLASLLPNVDSATRSSVLATIRQGETLANTIAPRLGIPVAAAVALPVTAGGSTTGGISQSETSSGSAGTSAGGSDSGDISKDPSGTAQKRVHDGVDGGCRVPGSANGLGGVTAPLAKVLCN